MSLDQEALGSKGKDINIVDKMLAYSCGLYKISFIFAKEWEARGIID